MKKLLVAGCGLLVAAALSESARAQADAPAKPKAYVVYAAEQETVAAGKHAFVELRFHVVDGYHINSHTPKSEWLIPTVVKLDAAEGVTAGTVEYPAGKEYSFSFDPKEKLDVYSGDFTVKVPVVAVAGEHTVAGTLHYQACDNAACYPPRNLAVTAVFTAK